MDKYLITLSDGSTVLSAAPPGNKPLKILPDGLTEVSCVKLEGVSDDEYRDLSNTAATHTISYDMDSGEIQTMPKQGS